MALDRPVPGQPLKSSSQRDLVGYVEASTPKAGSGVRVVRTASGSRISSRPSPQTMLQDGSSDSFPNGTEIWGRVVFDTTGAVPALRQYKLVWDASSSKFVESATSELIMAFGSHEVAHGVIA